MIAWLSLVGAVAVCAVAAWRLRHNEARPRDPDWGDWPPDDMAP